MIRSAEMTIEGGSGDDLIKKIGDNVEDEDEEYDDEIDEEFDRDDKSSINAGTGNDLIEIESYHYKSNEISSNGQEYETLNFEGYTGQKITVAGGAGNDTIRNTFIEVFTTTRNITEEDVFCNKITYNKRKITLKVIKRCIRER